ncbi:hypothetical protein SDC9_147650 [bioreactor metagenome]|uniref:Uncharacterized protein n=1 Tax=bioreactor metagenome TaxID=1076179 RepID=A0A645EEH6_9ZZZZ
MPRFFPLSALSAQLGNKSAIMLKNTVILSQRLANIRRILLKDGVVRNHVKNPIHLIFFRVGQREAEAGESFPSAGRYVERIDTRRIFCGFLAMI